MIQQHGPRQKKDPVGSAGQEQKGQRESNAPQISLGSG